MRVLKVIWGLLVDDGRLASILCGSLLLSFVAARLHHPSIAAVLIWLGLILSLSVSVGHQLRVVQKK